MIKHFLSFPQAPDVTAQMKCQRETEWDLCARHLWRNRIFFFWDPAGNTSPYTSTVKGAGALWRFHTWTHTQRDTLTCVVEEGVDEGAVFEGGAHGGDVLEVAVEERRVDEGDGFELHADEPGGRKDGGSGRGNESTHGKDFFFFNYDGREILKKNSKPRLSNAFLFWTCWFRKVKKTKNGRKSSFWITNHFTICAQKQNLETL